VGCGLEEGFALWGVGAGSGVVRVMMGAWGLRGRCRAGGGMLGRIVSKARVVGEMSLVGWGTTFVVIVFGGWVGWRAKWLAVVSDCGGGYPQLRG